MGRGTTRLKSNSGSMLMPIFVHICEFVCIRISRVTLQDRSQHNDIRRREHVSSRSGRGVEIETKGEGGEGNGDGIGIRLY